MVSTNRRKEENNMLTEVSIPYRYGIYINRRRKISRWRKVSIPYRYGIYADATTPKQDYEVVFQFLIGMVSTWFKNCRYLSEVEFQFLIGMVSTLLRITTEILH